MTKENETNRNENEKPSGKSKPALPPSTWQRPRRLFNVEPNQERVRLCSGQQARGLDPSVMELRQDAATGSANSDLVPGDLKNNNYEGIEEYVDS